MPPTTTKPTREEQLANIGASLSSAKTKALGIQAELKTRAEEEAKVATPLPTPPTTTPTPTPTQPERFSRLTPTEQQAQDTLAQPVTQRESAEEIQARKTKAAQAEIDALNRMFQDKLAVQRVTNLGQERQTSSVSTLTGLAGSTEANIEAKKTEALGGKQLDAIRNEQAVAIQSVLSDIRTSATEEARFQADEARQSARDILALRTQRSAEATKQLTLLGKDATATLEGLRETLPPEDYEFLIRNVGGEEFANAILVEGRDAGTIEFSEVIDGQYVQMTRMPDGTLKKEVIDLIELGFDATKEMVKSQKMDDGRVLVMYDDNTHEFIGEKVTDTTKALRDQSLGLDIGLKKQKLAEGIDAVTPESKLAELDPTSQSILAQTGLSIPAYSFLTTGVKALTRMSSRDRKKFMAEAEKWSIDSGLDISTFQSEFQAFNEVVQRNIKISALVGLAGEDIKGSLSELTALTEKEGFGDVKIKNIISVFAGEHTGDPVALQYKFILNDLRSAVSGFFAVQQGRTSSEVSDREDAKELINNGLASGSISGLIETINQVSQRTERIADDSVGFAQDKIWEMFGVTKPNEVGGDSTVQQGTIKSPDGTQFINTADLTPEELQEAKDAGWI